MNPKTGLKRPIVFTLKFNNAEYEYLWRRSRHDKTQISKLIRNSAFPFAWQRVLRDLREKQGPMIRARNRI